MESSLILHQLEAQEEEEKEMVTFMECDVYSAAEKGEINPVIAQRKDSLQSLLTPQRNTVLHIYLKSITREDPEPEINEFVECILGFCPALLMQVNNKKKTPLHIAARYGHVSIVNQFIKHAKEDHPDHNQDHKSHRAEVAKKMLRMTSKEGDTALHEAVRFGHRNVVEKLIAEDGDFEHNANKSGETPLYLAVQRGYNDITKEIIERCDSPATSGPNGRNVLHAASKSKDKEMIESILKKFGEQMLKQADQKGWTPLHCAAHMGNLDAVKTLLTKEMGREAAYMKNTDGDTPLHLATVFNNKETMLEIIKWCPDSSELVNKKGWNILHSAVQNPYRNALTKDILQSSTSLSDLINYKDGEGMTPLHYAARMGNLDVVKTFLTKKMGREAAYRKNIDGDTALHLAAVFNNKETMLEIIKWCPDTSELVNNKGQNALQILQSRTSLSNLINDKDGDGNSVDLPGMDLFKNTLKKKGLRSNMRIYTEIKDSEQDKKGKSLVDKLKKV